MSGSMWIQPFSLLQLKLNHGLEGVAWVGLAKDWILFLILNCSVSPCGKLS